MTRARTLLAGAAILAIVSGGAAATASGTAWERDRLSMDVEVLVLLSGCDGLIAEGGVPSIPGGPPLSYAFTHNFVAAAHIEGWTRRDPSVPAEVGFTMHARITGTGTDAAGRTFTLSGNVSQDGFEADFWADDGNVVVRRDDGAFARDAGVIGAHGIVNSPPLLFFGRSLMLDARHCRL